MNVQGNEEERDPILLPSLIAVALVVVVYLLSWWSIHSAFGAPETPGSFGDQFGAINTLYSGLAFAGIVLAVFFQRRELRLQRRDLGLSRDVLEAQRLQLEKQANSLQQQSFESTFFELLRLHATGVSRLDIRFNSTSFSGTDCFPPWLAALRGIYEKRCSGHTEPEPTSLESAYREFRENYEQDLGRYFRSLKNLIHFLDRASITDKEPYSRAIRSQLTDLEMILVFYECEAYSGSKEFGNLVYKHAIIRGFNRRHLLTHEHQQLRCAGYRTLAAAAAPWRG